MNELDRRYRRHNSGGFPYGTTEDTLAFEEFARVMGANAGRLSKSFGGHENFLAYLNGVQPSRNVEVAPYDPYYNPHNAPHMGFTDEEQAQHMRGLEDDQDTNPMRRPERDTQGEFISWMSDLFSRGARVNPLSKLGKGR